MASAASAASAATRVLSFLLQLNCVRDKKDTSLGSPRAVPGGNGLYSLPVAGFSKVKMLPR